LDPVAELVRPFVEAVSRPREVEEVWVPRLAADESVPQKRHAPRGGRKHPRRQPRQQAVRDVLPKLVDQGGNVLYPDGKVPGSVPTETVLNQVITALGYDVNWDGWHTVNRALDRE
jgi:hypothetical protein